MTVQMPDKMRWKGGKYDLCTLPLEVLFLAWRQRPPFEIIHTANHRGYWAYWRMPYGKLVLGRLEPNLTTDGIPADDVDPESLSEIMASQRKQHERTVKLLAELAATGDRIVPSETMEIDEGNGFVENDSAAGIDLGALLRAKEQPVFASWYSGLLRLQKGNFVRDWHSDSRTTTEREVIVEIREGIARQHWIIDYAQAARQQRARAAER
jgi:hypothetical protein